MSTAPQPLPMAGDFLVATFADLMHAVRFRKHVWSKMQLDERRRLESLRLQALYGDAPDHSGNHTSSSSSPAVTSSASSGTTADDPQKRKVATQENAGGSSAAGPSSPPSPAATPSPPRWFDIAGRARYSAWVALRGCMSADVAAECFCAEFLGVIKKYPHPALLTPVEAALSTAHGLAQRARSGSGSGGVHKCLVGHGTTTNATAPSTSGPATTPMFCVRALQGDPAALALLWLCRAYRIPCEYVVEPLSKALRAQTAKANTAAAAAAATSPTSPYLPYTLADACFPFEASITYPTGAASAASTTAATVTTPEAAFVLMADTFLAAYPHWMSVPSDLPASSDAALSSSHTALVQRCGWIDELQHITRHVRTPILALLVHHATQTSSAAATTTASFERQALLRAVAAHLHRYESWTMERVVRRRVGQALSVLSPILASTAVVDALRHAYAPDAKAVTAADVYLASSGYVLCTHPFCADVFPLLRVPVSSLDVATGVRAEWPEKKAAAAAAATAGATSEPSAGYAPWGLPLYLSGLPAECNETINRVLRRESRGAAQHEQRQQAVRLLINDCNAAGSTTTPPTMEAAVQQQQQQSARYYAVSSASVTKEAAEAVGQLILARLHSVRSDDLQHTSAAPCTSSLSGVPFLVLGQVLALTWALAQEQLPAFPYFMLDGNPDHFGGFSFLREDALQSGEAATSSGNSNSNSSSARSQRSRRRFQMSLAPALTSLTASAAGTVPAMLPAMVSGSTATPSASSNDNGVSLESRLRRGLHGVTSALLKGTRRLSGASNDDEAQSGRGSGVHTTHVLRSEGGASSGDASGGSGIGGGVGVAATAASL